MNELQVILGQPPSKSNSYRIITIHGHGSLAKTNSLKEYERSFYLQCDKYRDANICGLFELHLSVYNKSRRPDLDNSLKVILDMLQKCNAIKNDRNCVKIVASYYIDKNNPRIEFKLITI